MRGVNLKTKKWLPYINPCRQQVTGLALGMSKAIAPYQSSLKNLSNPLNLSSNEVFWCGKIRKDSHRTLRKVGKTRGRNSQTHGCEAWIVRWFACPSDQFEPSPFRGGPRTRLEWAMGMFPLSLRGLKKRQGATEPTIWNRERDPRLAWSFLRGKSGDSINCPDEWGWLQHLEPVEGFWLFCVFSSQVVPEYGWGS